jgi:hypothetical protein
MYGLKMMNLEPDCIKQQHVINYYWAMGNELAGGYQNIMRSRYPLQAITDHFQILIDTEESQLLLQQVISCISRTEIQENKLVLEFNNGLLLTCHGPRNRSYHQWPRSFQKIMTIHSLLEYGYYDQNISRLFVLGDHGSCLFEDENFQDSKSPMIDNQSDWWIYDNVYSPEPDLLLVSHGSLSIVAQTNQRVGHLFLRRIASTLTIIK